MSANRGDKKAVWDQPEAIAIRAFGFVTGDRAELDRFLLHTGLSPAELMRRPIYREHLAAILDFLITDETSLLKFARIADLPPEAAYEARRAFGNRETQPTGSFR